MNLITLTGAAFLLYAGVSISWSPEPTLAAAWLGSLALCFMLGAWLPNVRWIWFGFAGVVSAFVCMQHWLPFDINSNVVACGVALSLAAALVYRFWWFIPIGVVGLWIAQSRAGLFVGGALVASRLWSRYPALAWCVFLLSIIAGAIVWQSKLDHNIVDNIGQRFGVWQDTVNHLTLFGNGFGSFGSAYSSWPIHRNMTGVSTAHAYNDFLELVFDLGIGTIPLWILISACLEVQAPVRLICFAFLLLSLTFFPLFIPPLGHLFALTLGQLARIRHGQMEAKDSTLPHGSRYQVGV